MCFKFFGSFWMCRSLCTCSSLYEHAHHIQTPIASSIITYMYYFYIYYYEYIKVICYKILCLNFTYDFYVGCDYVCNILFLLFKPKCFDDTLDILANFYPYIRLMRQRYFLLASNGNVTDNQTKIRTILYGVNVRKDVPLALI